MLTDVVEILRRGGTVTLSGGYELAARTYRGYRGRNPMTGAPVDVPQKSLPLLQKATGEGIDLGLEEIRVLDGAPVWVVRGVGFIVGFQKEGSELRTLDAFASFRAALNGALGRFASAADDAIRDASRSAARLSEDDAVGFASVGDFSWQVVDDGRGAFAIETSTEPKQKIPLDAFLRQAALVAAITAAAGDDSLSETMAIEVMRAMLAIHPSVTQLTRLLPF